MDGIYEELDGLKVEVQKLREECRTKSLLYDDLRKSHIEQVAKVHQSESEIDKLIKELNSKSEEICETRKLCEELQHSLGKKDLFLHQMISANEKLRVEHSVKIANLESKNIDLVVALDAASVRIEDLEKTTSASSVEIAGLKGLLSVKQEKDFEEQKNASKNLKDRDECVLKLEEECRDTQDKLKWKNEQFLHLEEAHRKLQIEFEGFKVEWHEEKSTLIDEIYSLQASLNDQIRISESMETELKMSNQDLAHEESRRKVLEIELSESKSQFENVFAECQGARSEIELLTVKRDEEIAELRTLLRKKELLAKETKYKMSQLEQENRYLIQSLKDAQEAQLNTQATSSLTKLRNKIQSLERLHAKCSVSIKEKEAELNSHIDKQKENMNKCLSELEGKDKSVTKLQEELEDCKWLLDVKDEEISAVFMVLKSEFQHRLSEELVELEKTQRDKTEKDGDNLVALLNDKDWKISRLQDHIDTLESVVEAKSEAEVMQKQEKDSSMRLAEDKNRYAETLEKEIAQLKNELAERESIAHETVEQQRELFLQKDSKIEHLQRQIDFLDQNLRSAMISLAEKDEALMRVEAQKMLETEERNRLITDLAKRLSDLHKDDDELTIKLGKMLQLFEEEHE